MRRVLGTPVSCRVVRRLMTTQAFVARISKVQQELQTATDRKPELIKHGRRLFAREVLEDLPAAYSPSAAAAVCQVAAQLRVAPETARPHEAIVRAAMTEEAVAALDPALIARVVHSCLVLHAPPLYELLFTYLRPLMSCAAEMDAVTLAVLLNAYGRAGISHELFYRTLCDTAALRMRDPRLSLAHVANVLHALSRVRVRHRPLLLVLREHALRLCDTAPDIVAVTILDAYAELGEVDVELFEAYETRLLSRLSTLQVPLLTALLACLATARRATATLLTTVGERVMALAANYDAASIAKTCDAYYRADVLSEDVFGTLAERACKVASDFRADEVHLLLNALSAFDLFDAELYPIMANRIGTLCRCNEYVGAEDAAGILASFAAVKENNDELVHYCMTVLARQAEGAMSATAYVNALWACAVLGVQNEAQRQLLAKATAHPELLQLPTSESTNLPTSCTKMQVALQQRRAAAMAAYDLNAPAQK